MVKMNPRTKEPVVFLVSLATSIVLVILSLSGAISTNVIRRGVAYIQ